MVIWKLYIGIIILISSAKNLLIFISFTKEYIFVLLDFLILNSYSIHLKLGQDIKYYEYIKNIFIVKGGSETFY